MSECLETNLEVIRLAAEPTWADNWNFRAYLQQCVDPAEIDRKAIALCEDISSKIDCRKCGNCCREIFPYCTGSDVARLAREIKCQPRDLLLEMKDTGDGYHVFQRQPCPFLENNQCAVYAARPDDCREYPHLHKNDFLGRSIGAIENYGTCPIIFNVPNQLKKSFSYNPGVDYIGDQDPETTFGSSFIS